MVPKLVLGLLVTVAAIVVLLLILIVVGGIIAGLLAPFVGSVPISYNFRSIKERWTSTIVAVLGIAGTVGVFVAMLSLARGFKATLVASGSPGNAPAHQYRHRRQRAGPWRLTQRPHHPQLCKDR